MLSTIPSTFLMSMPGGSEMILIVVVVLLLFGGKKIPELMKGIGKGIREFKDAKESVTSEFEKGIQQPVHTTVPVTETTK
jgi:sec-independent protein translocase protein TatA